MTEEQTKDAAGNETKKEALFTQDDVNKIIQERLKDEKNKFEKLIADQKEEAEKQAKLSQMTELDRLKAEKDDLEAKFQAEADKNALALQKDETRKLMQEKELPECFLESVLIPKDNEATKARIEKIKTTFDEAVKKAVEAKIPAHVPNSGSLSNNANGIKKDIAQKPWNRFKQ